MAVFPSNTNDRFFMSGTITINSDYSSNTAVLFSSDSSRRASALWTGGSTTASFSSAGTIISASTTYSDVYSTSLIYMQRADDIYASRVETYELAAYEETELTTNDRKTIKINEAPVLDSKQNNIEEYFDATFGMRLKVPLPRYVDNEGDTISKTFRCEEFPRLLLWE